MAKKKSKQTSFDEARTEFPQSDEWFTPPKVLNPIRDKAPIVFDPFGSHKSLVKATVTNVYDGTPQTDGFLIPWYEGYSDVAFMNTPFSRKFDFSLAWLRNCMALKASGYTRTLFCILPNQTEQKFFHNMLSVRGSYFILYKSRINYWKETPEGLVEGDSPSFGSVSFVYGSRADEIALNFRDIATVIGLG